MLCWFRIFAICMFIFGHELPPTPVDCFTVSPSHSKKKFFPPRLFEKKKGNDEKMFLIKKKIYTKKKKSKKKVTRETQLRNVHCSYFSSPVEDKTTILRLLNVLICPHSFFVHRRLWFIRPPTLPLRVHTCPGERLYLRHHQWLMGSWQSFLLFHWRPL